MKVTTAKYYIPSGRCIQAIDYAKRNADGRCSYSGQPDQCIPYSERTVKCVMVAGIRPDVEVKVEISQTLCFICLMMI